MTGVHKEYEVSEGTQILIFTLENKNASVSRFINYAWSENKNIFLFCYQSYRQERIVIEQKANSVLIVLGKNLSNSRLVSKSFALIFS
jgi:hypothetical protein